MDKRTDRPTATLLVGNIRVPLGCGECEATARAVEQIRARAEDILCSGVHKVSVDARRGRPALVYTIAVVVPAEQLSRYAQCPGVAVQHEEPLLPVHGSQPLVHPPVVCGLGPAGLFAAYLLASEGYRPIVLERGPAIEKRVSAVEHFWKDAVLDPEANIQFGEGGAGTFSDGKLTTRIHDPLCGFVTRVLLENGAPPEIAMRQKPHIGTDRLRGVIVSIRQKIERLGGRVLFETRLTGLEQNDGRLCAVQTTGGRIPCETLLLAPGHSARDTFAMLASCGLELQCKPFSVGFRAEHLQSEIEKGLYHEAAGHPDLPRGEYQLASHIGGRGVYTFCMCPGGQVVAAASEPDSVVTNGMSYHARDGKNANAAVVVSVDEKDFNSNAFAAIEFQRRLERSAYILGGGAYRAPAQSAALFVEGRAGLLQGPVVPSYPLGVRPADLAPLFGDELAQALRAGLRDFGRRINGYAGPNAVLTGVETRTSSPVRLPRTDALESTQLSGLYPAGEGAGYAGGIVSAAVDGLRSACAVINRYCPPVKD